MPQAIGAAIIALGSAAGVTITATAAATLGNLVVAGALVGAQLLLAPKPDIPKPQDGKVSLKQTIPPPIYGYGRHRIAGPRNVFEMVGSTAYVGMPFHQGLIDGVEKFYLHDDAVEFDPGQVDGPVLMPSASGRYRGDGLDEKDISIYWRLGLPTEAAYPQLIGKLSAWGADCRGDGVASVLMVARTPNQKNIQKRIPFGLPEPSVVARLRRCWDPRDLAQDPDVAATWTWTRNPMRHLLHFYCHCPAGYRSPVATVYERYAGYWHAAMDICDEQVERADGAFEPRYAAGGHYTSESPRRSIVEALLRSCDGWLTEAGDGGIIVFAGWYYEPSVVISDRHIDSIDISKQRLEDEDVNTLIVKVVSADHGYEQVEADPWVDQAEIDAGAITVAADAKAEWCQSYTQGRRLAKSELTKLRCAVRGKLVLKPYGENLKGRRFFYLNSTEMISTRMLPCEVVGLVDNTFENGTIEVDFQSVDVDRYAWDRMTEEGRRPAIPDRAEEDDLPIPPAPELSVISQPVAGGSAISVVSAVSPPVEAWPDLSLEGRIRRVGTTAWLPMSAPDDGLQVISGALGEGAYEVQTRYRGGGGSVGEYSPLSSINVVLDPTPPLTPEAFDAILAGTTATINLTSAANDTHTQKLEVRAGSPAQSPLSMPVLGTKLRDDSRPFSETPSPGVRRYYGFALNVSGIRSVTPAGPDDVTVSGQVGADPIAYPDGNLGTVGAALWTRRSGNAGAFKVVSGVIHATDVASAIYTLPDLYSLNYYIEFEWLASAGSSTGILLAAKDPSNYVLLRYTAANVWTAFKRIANVNTTVIANTAAALPASGALVRCERAGDTVRIKVGGVIIASGGLGGDLAALTGSGASAYYADQRVGLFNQSAIGAFADNVKWGLL
jgi:hypothetical protein